MWAGTIVLASARKFHVQNCTIGPGGKHKRSPSKDLLKTWVRLCMHVVPCYLYWSFAMHAPCITHVLCCISQCYARIQKEEVGKFEKRYSNNIQGFSI